MGKRNRRRRRRHTGAEPQAQQHFGQQPPRPMEPGEVEELLARAGIGAITRNPMLTEPFVATLVASWDAIGDTVARTTGRCLEEAVAQLWARGWQPADVPRVVARKLTARHAQLAVVALGGEAQRYLPRGATPDWAGQLSALGADRWVSATRPLLRTWLGTDACDVPTGLRLAAELLFVLRNLPSLPRLVDPPGSSNTRAGGVAGHSRTAGGGHGLQAKMLAKVQALLAKAESTTFPEEAEALTAKAQQLIARHAIDQAMLDHAAGTGTKGVIGRRVGLDDPYARAKSVLLSEVAAASRCRSIWSSSLGFSTVFGFPADIDAVELLHTSLLVQATAAMTAAGADPDHAHARSRSFRQSFLLSFAMRIGHRLRQAADAGAAEARATHGEAMLPVLRSRGEAVEQACREAYPRTSGYRLSSYDGRGWTAGAAAADIASLSVGRPLPKPAAS